MPESLWEIEQIMAIFKYFFSFGPVFCQQGLKEEEENDDDQFSKVFNNSQKGNPNRQAGKQNTTHPTQTRPDKH